MGLDGLKHGIKRTESGARPERRGWMREQSISQLEDEETTHISNEFRERWYLRCRQPNGVQHDTGRNEKKITFRGSSKYVRFSMTDPLIQQVYFIKLTKFWAQNSVGPPRHAQDFLSIGTGHAHSHDGLVLPRDYISRFTATYFLRL